MPSEIHEKHPYLWTPSDWREWEPPPQFRIIEGVLNAGSRLEIFGDEGSWKSNLISHLAFSLANGHPWLGFKTVQCNVIYGQAEMSELQIWMRNIKYCTAKEKILAAKKLYQPIKDNPTAEEIESAERIIKGMSWPENCITFVIDNLFLDEIAGGDILINIITDVIRTYPLRPVVIIIDPLYMVIRKDLSSQSDMSIFQHNINRVLRHFNRKQESGIRTQLAFIFVHHTRKSGTNESGEVVRHGSQESFGYRGFSWWSEAIMSSQLRAGDDTHTIEELEFTKYPKDSEYQIPVRFDLHWSRDTLHPVVYAHKVAESELETRGELDLAQFEA